MTSDFSYMFNKNQKEKKQERIRSLCTLAMAFNNIESTVPNLFLLRYNHGATCFCEQCRRANLDLIHHEGMPVLREKIVNQLPNERQRKANALFEVTKKQIIYGKQYKVKCLAGTRYTNFRCWAKKQPYYLNYVTGTNTRKKEFKRHCEHINSAAICFDRWDTIVSNLTDPRITHINARTLSVENLAHAVTIEWCLYYNAKCGGAPVSGDEANLYLPSDVDTIFQYVLQNGILRRINYDPKVAASFGKQVSLMMMKEAVAHQIDTISGTTYSYFNGLKKSWRKSSKEVGRAARSFSEFVDVEDVLKSVHRAIHPEQHAARKTSIIHDPIDWSKPSPSAYQRHAQVRPSMVTEDETNYQMDELMADEKQDMQQKLGEEIIERLERSVSVIDASDKWSVKQVSGSDENVKKNPKKKLNKNNKINQTGVIRSQTLLHERALTNGYQNVHSQPFIESLKAKHQDMSSRKLKSNSLSTSHPQRFDGNYNDSSGNEQSVYSHHFDFNPRNGLSRSRSLNSKKIYNDSQDSAGVRSNVDQRARYGLLNPQFEK